ncbi:MAG: type II toxin-antitoxin system VapC family toxin [Anaerolineaceae bacterium]|nr:type II toxin-antitoxin system VapC family toxin [Anaerolineaceae bacterium]
MKFLLDTHTLLWGLYDSSKLSSTVIQILSSESCYISIASLWEMAIKSSLGKINLAQPILAIYSKCKEYEIELLPIKPEHCQIVTTLPFIHKDQFDRIIIAQAKTENLTILTKDSYIPMYKVKTIW